MYYLQMTVIGIVFREPRGKTMNRDGFNGSMVPDLMGMQIPGIGINSLVPGGFPYLDPAPAKNPIYPVLAPGQISLPINVPVTTPADLGKEFIITLKNWNQCNAYDNNLADGNPFNPVSGNLINGDNAPQITTARIVIVPAPQPDFLTRLGDQQVPFKLSFA
jgi:hypothetical protein